MGLGNCFSCPAETCSSLCTEDEPVKKRKKEKGGGEFGRFGENSIKKEVLELEVQVVDCSKW